MRKNSPRKWLHAVLDLLPVIIIPIFAIYSHRHTIDSYEVTRETYKVVDFNQLIHNGNFENKSYWETSSGLDYSVQDNTAIFTPNYAYGSFYQIFNCVDEHKYLIRVFIKGDNSNSSLQVGLSDDSTYTYPIYSSSTPLEYTKIEGIVDVPVGTFQNQNKTFIRVGSPFDDVTFNIKNVNVFDLTQMFGAGNEPTTAEFDTLYPNDYYDYTSTKKELLENGTETLNNTDIGSQLLYSLYNPIHDYMNFNNVFNFGQIYDWMQLNIFGGTAPLSVFIVWNIVLYEFLMDLIFLMYALFMFFIDFCTNLIDRFHCTCSGKR